MLFLFSFNALGAQKIIVLGDSISAEFGLQKNQGWVHLLKKRLIKTDYPYTVINASISGETSGGGLRRITGLLKKHNPQIMLIALGANDGLRGLKIAKLKNNLSRMIELSLKHGAQPIIIGLRLPPNYGPIYTNQFTRTFLDVSKEHQTPTVPSFLKGFESNLTYFQGDRIHPNALAQPLILDNIWPVLLNSLSNRQTQR